MDSFGSVALIWSNIGKRYLPLADNFIRIKQILSLDSLARRFFLSDRTPRQHPQNQQRLEHTRYRYGHLQRNV